jgi:hypothetical protein
MAALCPAASGQSLGPENSNKLGKLDAVVASLETHIAVQTGPDCLVVIVTTVVFHISLDDQPRIKIGIIAGDRTDHGAFTAVKT